MTTIDNLSGVIRKHRGFCSAALITLCAFLLRYWLFQHYHNPLMLHEQDGIAYMSNAGDILSFRFPAKLYMPPFYSLVIALFSLLPVSLETAARIASITMDSLVILPLFGLARIALPRTAALVVCGLWATFHFGLFYAPSPLSQSTYLFMLLGGTFALYRAATCGSALWLYALSGACFSAAYQTRPEGILSLGAGLLLIAVCIPGAGPERRRLFKGAALFVLAFALCAVPYILALHAQLGIWTFTAKTTVAIKGIDGALTLGPAGEKARNGVELWLEQFGGIAGGLQFIRSNTAGFFDLLLRTFPAWTHPVALAGLLFLFIGRNAAARLFLLVPFLVTIPVVVVNLPKDSAYIYPLYPLYLLSFVAGLWGLLTFAEKRAGHLLPAPVRNMAPMLPGLLLLFPASAIAIKAWQDANVYYTAPEYRYQVEITDKIFRAAGEKVQSVSTAGEPVLTRWGLISYFAGRPLIALPKGTIDEVIAQGRKSGAKLMVIDTGAVETRRQELTELLNPLYGGGINPRYRLQVVAVGRSEVGGYVIYRLI